MKNNKGITLVALVVTIIVLLILAGVTIAMLTGDNGILTQTNQAKVTTIEGDVDEAVRLALASARLMIANKSAVDGSYDATNTSCADVVDTINDDLTEGKGYEVTGGSNTVTIVYTGDDYEKATNTDGASITYTITVSQFGVAYPENGPVFNPAH